MWKYTCNLGIHWRGEIVSVVETQGTDVTYFMKSECGKTHVLSGKLLDTIWRPLAMTPT
jgi:hypothetical protein